MIHYVVISYLGRHHYNTRGDPFGSNREAAVKFARRCGGTARAPGIVAAVEMCDCEEDI